MPDPAFSSRLPLPPMPPEELYAMVCGMRVSSVSLSLFPLPA